MSRLLLGELANRFLSKDERVSRREFLRGAMASAATLMLSHHFTEAASAQKNGRRVVVIGAGFAGLAAAYELSLAGYEVIVLESRERVGGRVKTLHDFLPGKVVEAGGELIGANHPTWQAYAKKFKLQMLERTEYPDKSKPFYFGGHLLEAKKAESLWEEMDRFLSMYNTQAGSIDEIRPWRSPNAKELDAKTVNSWINALSCSESCKTAIRLSESSDANDPGWESLLGRLATVKGGGLDKYWTESEVYRCKGGNQQLAEHLADAIGRDRVRLRTIATAVDVYDNHVTVTLANGLPKLQADDLVLAVPPGTWKRITFTPPFPPQLSPQMSNQVKFLSAVRERFWEHDGMSPNSLGDGPVAETWEGTDKQDGPGHYCLTVFAGGNAADHGRGWAADQRNAHYALEIAKVFPRYPQYFMHGTFIDWPSDPWAQAGYSAPAPGQIITLGPILYDGLGRLHFAGEHCSFAFQGYMEGGLNSGAAVAKRIAQRDGVLR
jgi:monoamine oxidase